ncbi:MAG: hypothetical protein CVU94_02895 [Firmicutes bacterium HGW-Firmicutes-19]|nr:MAG: hypothetical protein CVU94_02895 [Firmicutes bacterium HGW-Firmicutes-19]
MKKRILLISYLFAPTNSIGAIRPTKLAKFLSRNGHQIDVVSADLGQDTENNQIIDTDFICKHYVILNNREGIPFRKLKNYSVENPIDVSLLSHSKSVKLKNNESTDRFKELKYFYRTTLGLMNSKQFIKNFEVLLSSEDFNGETYDTIISTFGPVQSAMCGEAFKRKFGDVRWICDFRDPMVVDEISSFLKPYFRYLQNRMIKKANIVTTVSQGYKERISMGRNLEKIRVITNGFDVEDSISVFSNSTVDYFSIVYVGSMYEGKRDFSPIFKVFRDLINEKLVNSDKVSINYAGLDFEFFCAQSEEFSLSQLVTNHGNLSRDECLKLQFSSKMLLLSTWNYKNQEGVVPGKLFEYMLIKKPIIAVIEGDIIDSEVKLIMENAKLGVTYESVSSRNDYVNLKNYIIKQYNLFTKGIPLEYNPNTEVINSYNWESIVQQFEDIV